MAFLETFPSISDAEFQAGCKALENRGFDRLNGTDWLSVRWSGEELLIKERRQITNSNSNPTREENNDGYEELENEDDVEERSDNPDIMVCSGLSAMT